MSRGAGRGPVGGLSCGPPGPAPPGVGDHGGRESSAGEDLDGVARPRDAIAENAGKLEPVAGKDIPEVDVARAPGSLGGEAGELGVVGGEEDEGVAVEQVADHRHACGDPFGGVRAPEDLVDDREDAGTGAGGGQDRSDAFHLDLEGAPAIGEAVHGDDVGEDPEGSEPEPRRADGSADPGEQGVGGHRPEKRRFPGHVATGDDEDRRAVSESEVVADGD